MFQSDSFIKEIKAIFKKTPVISSAKKLKSAFMDLQTIFDFSEDDLKKFLQNHDVIMYSRSSPRGYSLNHEILENVAEKTAKNTQFPLLHYPEFINQLKSLFKKKTLMSSLNELKGELDKLQLPPQWDPVDIKKELSSLDILKYSRSAPRGYSLNMSVLKEKSEEVDSNMLLTLENELYSPIITESKVNIKKEQSREENKTRTEKTTKTRKTVILEQDKPKKKKNLDSSLKEDTSILEKKEDTVEAILEKNSGFPSYLLERMTKTGREAIKMGVLEINKLDIKNLKKYLDALANSRMFYDGSYESEREIVEYIDKKVRYMSKVLEQMHNQEAEKYIQKYVKDKIKEGKFDKIVKGLSNGMSYDDCAWEITENIGWWGRRKIPLNDFALRKRVSEILHELFPEKN